MEDLEQRLSRALDLGEEGDYEGMGECLLELLEEHPEDATVLSWLGVAEHEMGLAGSAYERFRACLALEPTDPRVLATIGVGLARFDDIDAETALRNAAILAPGVAQTRVAYGGYLAREGMVDDALGHLDAALSLAPDDAEVQFERGVALGLAGRHEEAAESFLASWELEQDDGWPRAMAGLAEIEAQRLEEAVGDLSAAMMLLPEDHEIALALAMAAAAIEREDLAYGALEGARMRSAGPELAEIEAVEERLEDDAEAVRTFLSEEFAPALYRRRLMMRP